MTNLEAARKIMFPKGDGISQRNILSTLKMSLAISLMYKNEKYTPSELKELANIMIRELTGYEQKGCVWGDKLFYNEVVGWKHCETSKDTIEVLSIPNHWLWFLHIDNKIYKETTQVSFYV